MSCIIQDSKAALKFTIVRTVVMDVVPRIMAYVEFLKLRSLLTDSHSNLHARDLLESALGSNACKRMKRAELYREKSLNYDTFATEASVKPAGTSGARMALQSCSKLKQEG